MSWKEKHFSWGVKGKKHKGALGGKALVGDGEDGDAQPLKSASAVYLGVRSFNIYSVMENRD